MEIGFISCKPQRFISTCSGSYDADNRMKQVIYFGLSLAIPNVWGLHITISDTVDRTASDQTRISILRSFSAIFK